MISCLSFSSSTFLNIFAKTPVNSTALSGQIYERSKGIERIEQKMRAHLGSLACQTVPVCLVLKLQVFFLDTMNIFDMMGRHIYSSEGLTGLREFVLSQEGVYVIVLKSGDAAATQKLIVKK